VYFSDLLAEEPALPIKAIAVFDIEPHRKATTFGISTVYEYYYAAPAVHKRFLEDIHAALRHAGLSMALKSKRYLAGNRDKSYMSFMRRFAEEPGVVIASPELAAPRLMRQCLGAISAPFSSTALYFRDEGYLSIYYDPLSLLDKNDPGAHGIPILAGRSELIKWAELVLVCRNQFSESK
jgi:polysaccharide biosynthesis PFTS motif protein